MLRLALSGLNRRKLRILLLAITVIITTSFLAAVIILGDSLLIGIKAVEDNPQIIADLTPDFITFVRNVLITFDILAMLVGIFVIHNTFTVLLTQRSRELALLRTIGAYKAQIFKLVIWEACIVGLVGALIGIASGAGLAQLFFSLGESLDWQIPNVGLQFSPAVFIWPIVLGILVTVISSILPAIKAGRRSPLTILAGVEKFISNKFSIRRWLAAIFILIGSAIAMTIIMTEIDQSLVADMERFNNMLRLRILVLFAGFTAMFAGFTLLTPLIAKFLARGLMRLLRRSRAIGWRLAAGNAWRQPLRLAATANVLMIGITMITIITVIIGSFQSTAVNFVEQFLPVDWTIAPANDDLQDRFDFEPAPIVENDIYQKLSNIDEQIEVIGVRYDFGSVRLEIDDQAFIPDYLATAVYNFGSIDPVDRLSEALQLDLDEVEVDNLAAGQIMVSRAVLQESSLRVGSDIVVLYQTDTDIDPDLMEGIQNNKRDESTSLQQTFTVGGSFNSYFDGIDLIVDNDVYERFTQKTSYSYIAVSNFSDLKNSKVRSTLNEIVKPYDEIQIFGLEEFIDQINEIFGWILNIFRGLLGLSFIVAVAGIFNTLLLSVFERTRELGLLRAIGTSAGLIRRMIAIEAIQIAILGVTLGTLLGIFFAWGIIQVAIDNPALRAGIEDEDITFSFLFTVPFMELLLYYAVAVVLALMAAFWPALRASRLKIIDALKAE